MIMKLQVVTLIMQKLPDPFTDTMYFESIKKSAW